LIKQSLKYNVNFYSGCGYSKAAKGVFAKVAKKLNPKIFLGAVDIDKFGKV